MLFWLLMVCIFHFLVYLKMHYQMSLIPELSDQNSPQLTDWPFVSIIIPACNEEENVRAALCKVLTLDYPNYQVIAVNDRSTDQTGAILDELADSYSQLEVIHISTLPEGWLGKVHALHVGTQQARGEYLIYADADIHFHPHFFKKVRSPLFFTKFFFFLVVREPK